MKKHTIYVLSGALFGVGMHVSQMTNPEKVINFLDVTGNWDPSLALVMAAAVAVTLITFRFIIHSPRPLFEENFHLPTRQELDGELFGGAAIFGIGWGLAGYCPGPAIAGLVMGFWEPFAFVAAMIAGSLIRKWWEERPGKSAIA